MLRANTRILLFLIITLSVLFQQVLLLAIGSLFLLIIDRSILLSILFFVPVIAGVFDAESGFIPIPADLLTFGLITPIVAYDVLISKKNQLAAKPKLYYCLFIGLIIIGVFVALYQTVYQLEEGFLGTNIKALFVVSFSCLIATHIVRKGLDNLNVSMEQLLRISIPITLMVGIYFIVQGEQISSKVTSYTNFGFSKHGEFTAKYVMLSIFVYASLVRYRNKTRRLAAIITLPIIAYVILQSGSRNGLVSFALLTILFFLVYFKQSPFFFRMSVIGLILIIFVGILYNFKDTPTIRRLIDNEVAGGMEELSSNRTIFWASAIEAIPKKPLLGYGGAAAASVSVTSAAMYSDDGNVLHNTPLEFGVRYGILGLTIYFLLTGYLIRKALHIINSRQTTPFYKVYIIPFLCYLSLTFSSMLLSWQWQMSLWVTIGVCLSIISLLSSNSQRIITERQIE